MTAAIISTFAEKRVYPTKSSVSYFFFSSRRRHTRSLCDWSSDVWLFRSHGPAEVVIGLGQHPQGDAVGQREEHVGDRAGLGAQVQRAFVLLAGQQIGDVLARAPQQLGELDGDLVVAPREREELE